MPTLSISDIHMDKVTGATTGTWKLGKVKATVPNRFPTTAEWNAARSLEEKHKLPGEIVVSARLMFPESWKKLLTQDMFMKNFARRLSKDLVRAEAAVRLFFMVLRGEIDMEKADDLKTILDLQYLSDMDVITLQRTENQSPEDLHSMLKLAERWRDQRGIDKPLMPILTSTGDRETFEKFLSIVRKAGVDAIGFDARGGFHYHALRALGEYKAKRPETWIHTFQVQPKIRFAGRFNQCSHGMMLPYFGVDSFSRWVVPPPPEPLTKDKINFFDRKGWAAMKRKEFSQVRGKNLHCGCPTCKGEDLSGFFQGKVFTVLSRSKVHDHFAQREELEASAKRIRQDTYRDFLASKEYPKKFLGQLEAFEQAAKP